MNFLVLIKTGNLKYFVGYHLKLAIKTNSNTKIDLISKELNCAEHEYMNMSPSLIELATPLQERFPMYIEK